MEDVVPGPALPVAVVAVDIPLPHLDRGFDYAVPPELDAAAQPGVRVKVRFAGRDVDGFVLERRAASSHHGRLTPVRRVVSPEPVLTPQVAALARRVADDHVGTLADVLRLAVPPRHAGAEKALDARTATAASPGAVALPDRDSPRIGPSRARPDVRPGPGAAPDAESSAPGAAPDAESPAPGAAPDAESPVPGAAPDAESSAPGDPVGAPAWADYPAGATLLRRLTEGRDASTAWTALPGRSASHDWAAGFAEAAVACLEGGRGVLLVVPDARDVARLDRALTDRLGPGRHVVLTAAQGPQARYTAWLKVLRGLVRCVVGTRAAAFAPVADLGLVAWWDDGDDNHVEPRAPYPHVRDVLLAQADRRAASVLVGGYARTAAVQALVESGRLKEVAAEPAVRRAVVPRVHIAGEGLDEQRDGPAARAHLPGAAWRAARACLAAGPVLVQVPRRGYLPALACATCRTPARCPACSGPLSMEGTGRPPTCRWCGAAAVGCRCVVCDDRGLRSTVIGAGRTAEEIGRAFPDTPVLSSRGGHVIDAIGPASALVIATPGTEPAADGGYAAVLLLDAWASLDRPTLDAAEEAVRRWLGAAALARPGAPVVLGGVPDGPPLGPVEALVRWAPEWFAARELAERAALRLPPAAWVASLRGSRRGLLDLLAAADLPAGVDRHGPVAEPGSDQVHLLLRAPRELGPAAAAALSAGRAIRSARKDKDTVQVKIGVAEP